MGYNWHACVRKWNSKDGGGDVQTSCCPFVFSLRRAGSGIEDQRPEIRDQKPEIRDQRPEIRDLRSGARAQSRAQSSDIRAWPALARGHAEGSR